MSDHHWADEQTVLRAAIVERYSDSSALDYLKEKSPADDGRRVA